MLHKICPASAPVWRETKMHTAELQKVKYDDGARDKQSLAWFDPVDAC